MPSRGMSAAERAYFTRKLWRGNASAGKRQSFCHVALGALQQERSPLLAAILGAGLLALCALHLSAAWRERAADRPAEGSAQAADDGFVAVCAAAEIPESRARTVCLAGERVAVFRYDGRISAVSAVCRHQNGPLGEGKIVDGCITCPWHGYQYRLEDGCAPAPFTERLVTHKARIRDGIVEVDPRPLPPGTPASITCSRDML